MSKNKYAYLKAETAPRILVEAVKLLGIKETIGTQNNPTIMAWAKALGIKEYTGDSIPWCGLFIAYVCQRAGLDIVKIPLRAKAWAEWGTKQDIAMLGDVLVFSRDGGGHVGIYAGEDDKCYHVLGGNQGDSVCVTRIEKSRCIAIRRTNWKVSQPKNVRVLKVLADGEVSRNEA